MSRAPLPNHVRSPSLTNGDGSVTSYSGPAQTTTRPLQISRPRSRPSTPSNTSFASNVSPGFPLNNATRSPSRPQRSELRSRVSEYSGSERASTSSRDYYRESVATTRSDASLSYRPRAGISTSSITPANSKPRPQRLRSANSEEAEQTTPTSLPSVMAAFQAAGSRRRAMTNGSEDVRYQKERKDEMEAEKVRQQRIRDKVPGRRVNGKARAGDIDAVLDQIKDEWDFVIDPDFSNVELALQLLDNSSLGKDIDSFRRTKDSLSRALKGSVDKHYQAFAASLPHHASLLNHLGESQSQINDSRTTLQEVKDSLGSKRADLVQLWSRGQTLEEMLRILDQIEHLKSVPDLLETLISEKRLLQASVLLVRSLKTINNLDMVEIGAVADLRSYLSGQETALREILIDELHSHLYLKSFWCDSRWAAYVPNQTTFPKVEFEAEIESTKSSVPLQSSPTSPPQNRVTRFLKDLALRPNDPPHDLNDPSFGNGNRGPGAVFGPSSSLLSNVAFASTSTSQASQSMLNPESDSFAYMETLLESLAVLGKLGSALDIVAQRLPGEIYSLVETTLDEVGERAEYSQRGSVFAFNGSSGRSEGAYSFYFNDSSVSGQTDAPETGFLKASCLRLNALESSTKQSDHEILKDLFWTLYSKLEAVVQGMRIVYEVANRLGSRRDFKDSSGTKPGALFPLAEIWMPVQAEVRTLISDYLTDEEQGAVSGRNPIASINEILREGKLSRDKTKAVFRFTDTDLKLTNKVLKPHEDELTRVLRDTMPGLVQGSDNTVQASLSTVGTDDRLLGVGQHHRLLIRPDAFHVSVLFQPTLTFLARVAEVLPSGMESARASSAVLDEFVLKVYLPQLEEKVSLLFHQAVTGPEAFQLDLSSTRISPEPLAKASTQLMALINSLCAMLQTTPFHRENYSRLILSVIIQFYQRCSDRFQTLVSVTSSQEPDLEPKLTLAAEWAQKTELNPCLSELLATSPTNTSKQQQLYRQETNLELDFLGQGKITQGELISSVKNLAALASLYRSVMWFATELNNLNAEKEEPLSPTTPQQPELPSIVTPYNPHLPTSPSEQLQLPLSREMALRFQALLKTYEQVAEITLYSIRIDVRCRTIHYLDSAMRHGNYYLEHEAGEPDPQVIDLNAELGDCDELISGRIPKNERRFIFAGLGHLMESVIISNARHLRLVNTFGIKKIMRNIVALQQSIKMIINDEENAEFKRAKHYYSLFFMSPQDMLDSIRQKQVFSFDEYQTMLNLQCGVSQTQTEGGVPTATDRNYSMYMIDLHGLELERSAEGDS